MDFHPRSASHGQGVNRLAGMGLKASILPLSESGELVSGGGSPSFFLLNVPGVPSGTPVDFVFTSTPN